MKALTLRLWRAVYRGLWLVCVAGALGGCGYLKRMQEPDGDIVPAYGIFPVRLPLGAVSYQPPSPVHAGTTLTFTAQLPQGIIAETDVTVGTQVLGWHTASLLDDGVAPDATANDRVFTGQLEWLLSYGLGEMYVAFYARGSYDGMNATGQQQLPKLRVLP